MTPTERKIANARASITKAGVLCLWLKPAPDAPAADPWREGTDDEAAPPVVDPVPVPIAWFAPSDVGKGADVFSAFMQNTEIPAGSEVGLMPGDCGFDPEGGDTVVRNGAALRVSKIDRVAPADVPIVYFVWIG